MALLDHINFKQKLWTPALLILAAVAVVTAASALFFYRQIMDERIAGLRNVVESASGLARSLESEVQAGRLSRPQAMERFRALVDEMRYGQGGYLFAIGMDGVAIANAGSPRIIGTDVSGLTDSKGRRFVAEMTAALRVADTAVVEYEFPRAGQAEPAAKASFVKRFDPWKMYIGAGVYVDDVASAFITRFSQFSALFALLLLPALAIAAAINRDVCRTMDKLIAAMRRVAANDLSVVVSEAERRDELGAMARALHGFRDSAAERQRLEQERAEAAAARDRRTVALEALIAAFERATDDSLSGLNAASADLGDAAQSMAALVQQTNGQAEASSLSAGETAANVQTVAAAAEELTRSIFEIARQMERSGQVVAEAVAGAERAGGVVAHLSDAAQRIGEVVALIDAVAAQTNLLALNATIEAARAGEAGKGFAVVAAEVKALAGQTGGATEDIGRQVQAIQAASTEAVAAIQQISGVIGELRQISAIIAAAVEEQGAATREISRNVQQAAHGARSVTDNVSDIANAAVDAGKTADAVRSVADALAERSADLRDRIFGFLVQVKAA